MFELLKDLFESGKFQEVLDQLTQKEVQGAWATLPEEEQVACIYYKCRSLTYLGRSKEALQVVTAARTTFKSLKNRSSLLSLLMAQFYAFRYLGRVGETQTIIEEGKVIIEALTVNQRQSGIFWVALFEKMKGIYCRFSNAFDKALECLQRAITLFEMSNNPHSVAHSLHQIGLVYYYDQDYDLALEYAQRCLTLSEPQGTKRAVVDSLEIIGMISASKGELDKALDYYQRSLVVAETIDSPIIANTVFVHIGSIYYAKGELGKALDYYQQALTLIERTDSPTILAYDLSYIGFVYHIKGEFDVALDYLQRSLAIFEEIPHSNFYEGQKTRVLFPLIRLSLDISDLEQAQKYLKQLQQIDASVTTKVINLRKRLAEALILKQSPRMKKKAQAQTFLEQIVEEEVIHWDLTLTAMISLCDLLIYELKSSGDLEVWEEAKSLVQQFYVKTQDYQASEMIVNALLLRAKFATIDGELPQALKFFNQAKGIAKEKNLILVYEKVEREQKVFEAEFEKWQDLIHRNVSLQERLTSARLDEYLQKALKIVQQLL